MLYPRLVRPLLFRLDSERAHRLAIGAAERMGGLLRTPADCRDLRLGCDALGLHFANPVGLAAGFDKFAGAVHAWPRIGFGFAEIGSITRHAQPGNPPPRMFRLPADGAVINRMGFNNDGAVATAARLEVARSAGRLGRHPLGVNLGKSKAAPPDAAVDDYVASLEALWPYADYVVVNVSSPNTPGLRDLQESSALGAILRGLGACNARRAAEASGCQRPLLVKIAPDLSDAQVDAVVDLALELEIAGVVVSNTTIGREGLASPAALASEEGGLSGRPVRARSTELVRRVARRSGGRLAVIGVGGIFTAEDAWQKIAAGAVLVQLYTGLVYRGPGVVERICSGLVDLLARHGLPSIADAVGAEG